MLQLMENSYDFHGVMGIGTGIRLHKNINPECREQGGIKQVAIHKMGFIVLSQQIILRVDMRIDGVHTESGFNYSQGDRCTQI